MLGPLEVSTLNTWRGSDDGSKSSFRNVVTLAKKKKNKRRKMSKNIYQYNLRTQ
jgi:hypothetical protein